MLTAKFAAILLHLTASVSAHAYVESVQPTIVLPEQIIVGSYDTRPSVRREMASDAGLDPDRAHLTCKAPRPLVQGSGTVKVCEWY